MAATGVRISELVLFDVEDVKKGYRDIYSKGNKLRRVYIPAVLRKAFEEWPGFSQRPDGILFLNRFGTPLSASGIRFQLKVLQQGTTLTRMLCILILSGTGLQRILLKCVRILPCYRIF